MNTDCEFCSGSSSFVRSQVRQYHHWRIELHHSQYYLGRCAVILNRHLEDFFDISTKERDELFTIMNSLRKSINQAFHPDMFNYATLGNIVPHVHLHVIPRYKNPVTFNEAVFHDENWGRNYAPYNKNFTIPDEYYETIREAIASNLKQ